MGLPGWRRKDLPLSRCRVFWGGAGSRKGVGGVYVAAVVPSVTVAMGRRGHWAVGDRNGPGSVVRRHGGFELIGQDEFPEFGASGVTLGGDVHVGGVSTQQPRRQQREGDASSAAVDLQETRRQTLSQRPHYTTSVSFTRRAATVVVVIQQRGGVLSARWDSMQDS